MLGKVCRDPMLGKYPEIQLVLGKVPRDPVLGKYPEIPGIINQSEHVSVFGLDFILLCKVNLQIFMKKMQVITTRI